MRDVSPLLIELEISSVLTKREAYEKCVDVLQKALHFDPIKKNKKPPSTQKEESPYVAYIEMRERLMASLDTRLYNTHSAIARSWLNVSRLSKAQDDIPFKVDGRIRINPKTGKPLTKKEWKRIEKNLDKVLNWAFSDVEDILTKKAIGLGKILATMDVETAIDATYDEVDMLADWKDPYLENAIAFAEQNSAIYLTDIKNTARKRVQTIIVDATRNKQGTRQLERRLFDAFSDTNRDWRRVAETEMQYNFQNGFMETELQHAKEKGQKNIFVQGLSGPNACPFCKGQIDGKVFVLLASPPANGDQTTVDGKKYTAIWPGKSNVGRARADWWVAFPSHPHCQCTQNPYDPQFAKYSKRLADRMKARMK